jgi:hypothetical protein
MRRALAALAAAEAAKKARRAKNAEEKRALLSLPPKGSLGLEPVPDSDAEAAAAAARVEKTRAEAAAMGISLVAEAGSESDATVEADGLAAEVPETTLEKKAGSGLDEAEERADEADEADEAVEKTSSAEDDDSEDDGSDVDDDADVDDAEDSLRPADGWRRALDEMANLASLADAFSAADAMRRPAAVGASGPAVAPFGHAGFGAEDGDDDGAFDGTRAENRGGVDLIGEPRRTLGGGGDVARDAASLLNQHAFSLAPRSGVRSITEDDEDDEEATKTRRLVSGEARGFSKPTNVALLATATDPRATASRLKELAECTGAAVLRGARGGGGFGGAGEAAERVAFLARMATLQAANREAAKARRRRPVKHLLASAETVAELETVGRFGA